MHSSRVRKVVLTLIFVCAIAVLVMAYLTVKPQRDSAHLIRVLEQVQVGHTRIEDIAPALRSAGAVAGVKGGKCEADLTGPSTPKRSLSPDSGGGSSLPTDSEGVCGYNLSLSNDFQHGMRLAPITSISLIARQK
jgi:hypothetical protein